MVPSETDRTMSIGTMFDWVARVAGFVFLFFMLYVLFFPNWREPPDVEDEQPTSRNVESLGQTTASQPAPSAARLREQESGNIFMFPQHRRPHG
jgi:hypothetical protein